MPDPFSYAKASEHSHQAALFMWANMAARFGPIIANDPNSYTLAGFAKTQFENAGKLGYKLAADPMPQLKWLHAIHNQGHGDAVRGGKAKAEGVKKGVSDIFLPVPMRHPASPGEMTHGLYVELKPPTTGSVSPEQREFQNDMLAAGYAVAVARGWLEARNIICGYLGVPVDR